MGSQTPRKNFFNSLASVRMFQSVVTGLRHSAANPQMPFGNAVPFSKRINGNTAPWLHVKPFNVNPTPTISWMPYEPRLPILHAHDPIVRSRRNIIVIRPSISFSDDEMIKDVKEFLERNIRDIHGEDEFSFLSRCCEVICCKIYCTVSTNGLQISLYFGFIETTRWPNCCFKCFKYSNHE